jgi:hypothetical protein
MTKETNRNKKKRKAEEKIKDKKKGLEMESLRKV